MIYVSQGDIESIGLEVFIKSLFLIPRKFQKKIYLVVNKEVIKKHLDLLNYKYKFNKDTISISNFISISCIYIENFEDSPFKSFQYCVDNIDPKSVLFTLPMSKKNFQQASVRCLGHTDFFRNQFKNNKPKMFFISGNEKICLTTDHLDLKSVTKKLTSDFLRRSTNELLSIVQDNEKILNVKEIYFCGINPHAGEGGLIGNEDVNFYDIIKSFEKNSAHDLKYLIPADAIHKKITNLNSSLLVFPYHDQGLCFFKPRNDILGINLTLGLPFIRLSVDHGTAKDIWGKGIANPSGCLYALLKAFEYERILNE